MKDLLIALILCTAALTPFTSDASESWDEYQEDLFDGEDPALFIEHTDASKQQRIADIKAAIQDNYQPAVVLEASQAIANVQESRRIGLILAKQADAKAKADAIHLAAKTRAERIEMLSTIFVVIAAMIFLFGFSSFVKSANAKTDEIAALRAKDVRAAKVAQQAHATHLHQTQLEIAHLEAKAKAIDDAEAKSKLKAELVERAIATRAERIALEEALKIAKAKEALEKAEANLPNHSVYVITADNGGQYHGVSKNVQSRWRTHMNELKANTHHNYKLQDLYDKEMIRIDCFKVLMSGLTKEQAYEYEKRICPVRNTDLNIQVGGL